MKEGKKEKGIMLISGKNEEINKTFFCKKRESRNK